MTNDIPPLEAFRPLPKVEKIKGDRDSQRQPPKSKPREEADATEPTDAPIHIDEYA